MFVPTIVAVEQQYVLHIRSVFIALGIRHAMHLHLWPVQLYKVFQQYIINDTFWKKVIEHKMCVLIVSITFI